MSLDAALTINVVETCDVVPSVRFTGLKVWHVRFEDLLCGRFAVAHKGVTVEAASNIAYVWFLTVTLRMCI